MINFLSFKIQFSLFFYRRQCAWLLFMAHNSREICPFGIQVTNNFVVLHFTSRNETFSSDAFSKKKLSYHISRNSIICKSSFSRLFQCSIVTQKTIQTKEFLTKKRMKRVGSIKQALKPSLKQSSSSHNHSSSSDVTNNNESTKMQSGVSILGNSAANVSNGSGHHSKPDFHLPKSISSFLKKGSNTLTRKKDKANQVSSF